MCICIVLYFNVSQNNEHFLRFKGVEVHDPWMINTITDQDALDNMYQSTKANEYNNESHHTYVSIRN